MPAANGEAEAGSPELSTMQNLYSDPHQVDNIHLTFWKSCLMARSELCGSGGCVMVRT